MKKELKNWEFATNKLTESFVRKYFDSQADQWWVADEVGGVFHVNDYFFSLSDMVDFIRHRYSVDHMFEYYDYRLEIAEKDRSELPINIKNWLHLKNE